MNDVIAALSSSGVLTLTLNRPEKRNALTEAMYGALIDGLEGAEANDDVRVVVLRGAGSLFCAGNDIGDFMANGGKSMGVNAVRFLDALVRATKPLVAGVQGKAVGIGATLLLHCDFVVLAEEAAIITPFAALGLVPEAASSLLLPARIGHLRAFEMFALASPVKARDALAWGLANRVVSPETLDAEIELVTSRLSQLPPMALRATKALMRRIDVTTSQMLLELEHFEKCLSSSEAQQALAGVAAAMPKA